VGDHARPGPRSLAVLAKKHFPTGAPPVCDAERASFSRRTQPSGGVGWGASAATPNSGGRAPTAVAAQNPPASASASCHSSRESGRRGTSPEERPIAEPDRPPGSPVSDPDLHRAPPLWSRQWVFSLSIGGLRIGFRYSDRTPTRSMLCRLNCLFVLGLEWCRNVRLLTPTINSRVCWNLGLKNRGRSVHDTLSCAYCKC
jgi:hypothetical protein